AVRELFEAGFPRGTFVYDDGVVKGFVTISGEEIGRLFVELCLWGRGIGHALLAEAMAEGGRRLWVLEKNIRAIRFYERHGFRLTGRKKPVDDTAEQLVEMVLEA
ncbi:MAG: GNAT family N-acetyltransferase, partial [Clostridia bacterium]|nr:GNAT family N-acetyltransferase [Clostridia bacterium]